jgi:uncharacterized protein YaiL (DUF2058 family)
MYIILTDNSILPALPRIARRLREPEPGSSLPSLQAAQFFKDDPYADYKIRDDLMW